LYLLYIGVKLGLSHHRQKLRMGMFENKVLKRINWPIADEEEEEENYGDEIHNLYSLANIIRVFKSRKMKQVRHEATWGR